MKNIASFILFTISISTHSQQLAKVLPGVNHNDATVPEIFIYGLSNNHDKLQTQNDAVTLRGMVTDESGIKYLMVNGIVVPVRENNSFEVFQKLLDGGNQITVKAMDMNRNMTERQFTIQKVAMKRFGGNTFDYGYRPTDAPVVTIGKQVWISKNLNVSHFANGDIIPEAKTADEWKMASDNRTPAWCYYDNDPANGKKFGKLYNWYAVIDPRDLAPIGWHVPSDGEWDIVIGHLAGNGIQLNKSVTMAGYKHFVTEGVGNSLKSTAGWHSTWDNIAKHETGGNGNNSSGFTGLPAGFRNPNGTFSNVNYYAIWWCFGEGKSYKTWSRGVSYGYGDADRFDNHKGSGFSVRCVRDN